MSRVTHRRIERWHDSQLRIRMTEVETFEYIGVEIIKQKQRPNKTHTEHDTSNLITLLARLC